ncbi:MAG: orotate phosphoribosyltransferase [Clostridia bacterium]|nr:MAG: orotate phosphoribosyltransferase [Clostridia bacterium]
MLTPESIWRIFTSCQALRQGHFLLSSGRHSDQYVQCAQVLQHPEYAELLGREIADRLGVNRVEAVVGPALGGILVAHEVARVLGARAMFAERVDGSLTLRRSFSLEEGERVVVVEDVLTTGGSIQELMALVRGCGAEVVAAAALVDRSGGKVDLGVPAVTLISVSFATYRPEECPLCRQGLPVEKPGSRAQAPNG